MRGRLKEYWRFGGGGKSEIVVLESEMNIHPKEVLQLLASAVSA